MASTSAKQRKLKSVAPPEPSFDFDNALEEMAPEFVKCRDYMHAWRDYTATHNRSERTYKVTMRCDRCMTLKHRLLNERGSMLDSWYDYPDGYVIKGAGRLNVADRDKIRLRSLLAAMGTAVASA